MLLILGVILLDSPFPAYPDIYSAGFKLMIENKKVAAQEMFAKITHRAVTDLVRGSKRIRMILMIYVLSVFSLRLCAARQFV